MQRLSFIHISDLHLDTFLAAKKDVYSLSTRLHESSYESLENIVRLCDTWKPDFIAFTGDLYQHGFLSLKARKNLSSFFECLEKRNIPFYYVKGNHDHKGQNDSFFDEFSNVFVFADTWSSCYFPVNATEETCIAKIYGYSHNKRKENENCVESLSEILPQFQQTSQEQKTLAKTYFTMALLHATCNDKPSIKNTDKHIMSLCRTQDLLKFPIDYWALGHIHEHKILHENPTICYSGATQLTRMGETGAKGVVLVSVENVGTAKQRISTTFYPISSVESYDIFVQFNEEDLILTEQEAIEFITQNVKTQLLTLHHNPHCTDIVLRVFLEGKHPLYEEIFEENCLEQLQEKIQGSVQNMRVFVKSVKSNLRPCFNFEKAHKRDDILGEIFRVVQELDTNSEYFERVLQKVESDFKIKKEYELGFFQNSEMRSEAQLARYKEDLLRACENLSVKYLEPK